MPRPKRLDHPDVAQHVIQRGNDRQTCFRTRSDYLFYLTELRRSAEEVGCDIHAYVLMTNHVHLLVTPRARNAIPRTMQSLGRRFVRYFNKAHRRTGTLWEGRYRACPVEAGDYVLFCSRYFDLNPVRAGLAGRPGEYPWSSYGALAQGASDPLVTAHRAYLELGDSSEVRQARYRDLVKAAVPSEELEAIRQSVQRQHAYGSVGFRQGLEAESGCRLGPGQPGRPRTLAHPSKSLL